MDPGLLRARLTGPPAMSQAAPPLVAPAGDDMADVIQPPLTAAAVLVPFVFGPCPGVLLTKRTAHLSSHAGQVSFPGGRIDASDVSAEAAALREAEEEVGLDPARVELLGRLPDYVTGPGYRITPVQISDGGARIAGKPAPPPIPTQNPVKAWLPQVDNSL